MSDYSGQNNTDSEPQLPIEIPAEALGVDTLNNLIESFILREGTDYGSVEIEHAKKVQRIHRQLDASQIKIVFDPNTETVTLLTEHDWRQFARSAIS